MSGDNNGRRNRDSSISRRRFVEALGATGIATGLAGCSSGGDGGVGTQTEAQDGGDGGGDGDGDGDGSNEDTETATVPQGDPVEDAFTNAVWNVPESYQWNQWKGSNFSWEATQDIWERFWARNIETGERTGWLISDWGKDGSTFSLTLSDKEFPWHDGNGVTTATDVANHLKLDTWMQGVLTNFTTAEKITADDQAGVVEIELTEDFSESIIAKRFDETRVTAPTHVYEEFIQSFEDASTEEEMKSARKDLTEFTPKEPVGNGPFKFVSADSQKMILEKFEDHPAADQINWSKNEFIQTNSNQQSWQALKGDKVDGFSTRFTPQDVVQSFPDHAMEILIPANWGMGIGFNGQTVWKDPALRKAVSYVVDRQTVAENGGGPTKVGVKKVTGIPGTMQGFPEKILKDQYDQMEDYGLNAKPAKGEQVLKDAGYSKQKGTWIDKEGEPIRFPMKVPAGFSDWVSSTQTIVSQMKQFGFKAEMVTVEGSSFWEQWTNNDYEVMGMAWTVGNTVPYLNFDYQLRSGAIDAEQDGTWNIGEFQVAENIGDPNSSMSSIDVNSKLDKLAGLSKDADDYQSLVGELAWVQNQLQIRMPIQEKLDQAWYTTDNWNVPSKDSEKNQVHWPPHWHVRTGDLTAKTE